MKIITQIQLNLKETSALNDVLYMLSHATDEEYEIINAILCSKADISADALCSGIRTLIISSTVKDDES